MNGRNQNVEEVAQLLDLQERIIPGSFMGVLAYQASGRCILANEAAAAIVGTSTENLLQQNFREIESWKASGLFAMAAEVIASGNAVTREIAHTTSFGRHAWLNCNLSRFLYQSDWHLLLLIEDVTERRQAQHELKESEARLKDLIDLSSDWYWEQDDRFRFTTVSADVIQKIGIPSNAHLGKTRWELPGIKLSPSEWASHIATLEAHQPFEDFTYERVGPNGNLLFLSMAGRPIFDAQGTFKGYRGVGKDITERVRAERKLAEAEAQFRSLVEQSISGTYIIQQNKFTYLNPRFAAILGYDSESDLIGRDPIDFVAGKDRDRLLANRRGQVEGDRQSISYTFTALRKDGSEVEIGAHDSIRTHLGRPAIIGMLQDISEKKRSEDQIKHYLQQLETAFMHTVEMAMKMSEMRDPYTTGHERKVAKLAVAIGTELSFDEFRNKGLETAGFLHDVGKVTVPIEILSKPGKLTLLEYELVKLHSQAGYDIVAGVEFPWPVAQIILQHHERLNGGGYPRGLKGNAILTEARILAVADTVEAMHSHRPYRPGLGIDAALAEIERGKAQQYDAEIVDACLRVFRANHYVIDATHP